MRLFAILAALLSLGTQPAYAGVVVSVWTPGVAVFDPYDPIYVPAPRADYVWIAGSYDEFGYFIPGYWQPVAPNPGYIWAWGYWSGKVYHEGYWRPEVQAGSAWIPGYYVRGQYVSPRWVQESAAAQVRAQVHAHIMASEPPRSRAAPEHKAATRVEHKPAPVKAKPSPARPQPAPPKPGPARPSEKEKKKK